MDAVRVTPEPTTAAIDAGGRRFGLPSGIRACLFDLDGVLTRTSVVHAAAWKSAFDDVLARSAGSTGSSGSPAGDLTPFDVRDDYRRYVDGRPRADGVRAFLSSRGIELPEGGEGRPVDDERVLTVQGVGRLKNRRFLEALRRDGVEVYDGSRRYVEAVSAAGFRCALVSSSENAVEILRVTDLARWFPTVVDGVVSAARELAGKPAPDTFRFAASELGVDPGSAAVFEDALAGVQAGRSGGFGVVVGVDRIDQAADLRGAGADVVVRDLDELLTIPAAS